MKVAVFGLGYVGVVTAACLADDGNEVVGVDVSELKVDLVNNGETPIVEEKIADILARNVQAGRLRATTNVRDALSQAELAFVCVGTPSQPDGSLDLSYVQSVAREIAAELGGRKQPLVVVFRSTMLPGSIHTVVLPAMRAVAGDDLGGVCTVVYHPEFLREGSSVYDFYNPPKIVVGEASPGQAAPLLSLYGPRYEAPRVVCDISVAEMVKYCDNLFHALKITFANEIGQFCAVHGINSQAVMEIFSQDTKLNISAKYLKPGFAFGGSCLPKDMRAFLAAARRHALDLGMLQGVLPSNRRQIERALEMILARGAKRIGFHGLAFKAGTDDLRESPYVELAERLLGKGVALVIFDEHVDLSRIVGRNKSFIEQKLPHLSMMVTGDRTWLETCELILLCHAADALHLRRWKDAGIPILDLTGAFSGSHDPLMQSVV